MPPFLDAVNGSAPDAGAYEFGFPPWFAGASTTQCLPPVFSPVSGYYTGNLMVTLTSLTAGASLRYTTDGSNPTAATGTLYTGPLSVAITSTVKAIATGPLETSAITTERYQMEAPVIVASQGPSFYTDRFQSYTFQTQFPPPLGI